MVFGLFSRPSSAKSKPVAAGLGPDAPEAKQAEAKRTSFFGSKRPSSATSVRKPSDPARTSSATSVDKERVSPPNVESTLHAAEYGEAPQSESEPEAPIEQATVASAAAAEETAPGKVATAAEEAASSEEVDVAEGVASTLAEVPPTEAPPAAEAAEETAAAAEPAASSYESNYPAGVPNAADASRHASRDETSAENAETDPAAEPATPAADAAAIGAGEVDEEASQSPRLSGSIKNAAAMFEARASGGAAGGAAAPSAMAKWKLREEAPLPTPKVKAHDLAQAAPDSSRGEALRQLRGYVASQPPPAEPASQHKKAMMALERKGLEGGTPMGAKPLPSPRLSPSASPSVADSPRGGVREVRQAFCKVEEETKGHGTMREEAMRKLNAKGVVSSKQAFGVKSSQGSQHSSAMAAFSAQGVTTGAVSKASLYKAPVVFGAKTQPKKVEGSQAAEARAALLAKMGS